MIALICNSINIYLVLLLYRCFQRRHRKGQNGRKETKRGRRKDIPPLRKEEIGKVHIYTPRENKKWCYYEKSNAKSSLHYVEWKLDFTILKFYSVKNSWVVLGYFPDVSYTLPETRGKAISFRYISLIYIDYHVLQ